MYRFFLTFLLFLLFSSGVFAQCCAGGSGCPMAGGGSQGVLAEKQFDFNSSFQYINTDKFYKGDVRDTAVYFDLYRSEYIYSRLAYGITKAFTVSVEAGYYLNKTQVGLNQVDTITSTGIADLIIFPRYDVLNRTKNNRHTELTLGLGCKIPLGSYNDSTGVLEPFSGKTYYQTKPLGVQVSSGAQDIIFYASLIRSYSKQNFRIFANGIYIKKGWNPLGEKIGDYASVGLFAGKTFFKKLGVTLQVKGEWIDEMQLNKNIRLYAYPNYDPDATGSKKVFVIPQLSYLLFDKLTIYGLWELPFYQFVTKTQVGTEYQFTAGFSYSFSVKKNSVKDLKGTGKYYCPMHAEEISDSPGQCSKCGMDLEQAK